MNLRARHGTRRQEAADWLPCCSLIGPPGPLHSMDTQPQFIFFYEQPVIRKWPRSGSLFLGETVCCVLNGAVPGRFSQVELTASITEPFSSSGGWQV